FFVRAAAGQYDLDQPEQLLRLLVTMARNKLASAARRQHRRRRDQRRGAETEPEQLAEGTDTAPGPSQPVAGPEVLERFGRGLSPEDRCLADLRGEGLSWADIATRLGGTPQARRMQLARAVERVAHELGLDEADE